MTRAEAVALKLIRSGGVQENSRTGVAPMEIKFLEMERSDYQRIFTRKCPVCSTRFGYGFITVEREQESGRRLIEKSTSCDWCGQRYIFRDVERLRTIDGI